MIAPAMEDRTMTEHFRQALVGVFGGTYITLAISDIDELSVNNFALLNTADFDEPMQAVDRYLKSIPRCPDKVAFAFAGEIRGDTVDLEHRKWRVTRNDIRAATGATEVFMVNDVEAAALMVPNLSRYDVVALREGKAVPYGNKGLIICGSGMNAAGLLHAAGAWQPVMGHGSLLSFLLAPSDPAELRNTRFGEEPSYDEVFSGRGLVALYEALAETGSPPAPGARQIAAAGLSQQDPVAVRSLQIMATWLGRLAGEVALLFGASDGLYLGGGLPANIVPALQTGHFEQAFLGSGRRADYLRHIPIQVVKMAADASMRGAALGLGRASPAQAAPHRRSV
jgi:glucokinase